MKTHQMFNLRRFYILIRNTLFLNRTTILLVAGASSALMLFASGVEAFFDQTDPSFHQEIYLGVLFLGGFWVTGKIFKEIHNKERSLAWLMLPASTLEKFTSRLFLSTVVFIAGSMLLCFLSSVISEGVNWIMFGNVHPLFNPFDWFVLRCCAVYIVLQSPFLVGAVYFKKHALPKTILVFAAFALVGVLVIMFSTKLLFWSYFDGLIPTFEAIRRLSEITIGFSGQIIGIFQIVWHVGRVMFWAVIAPLCWITGYYRLKETEV